LCAAWLLFFPTVKHFWSKGYLKDLSLIRPRGIKGFGYDPVFFVPTLGKTLSEVSTDEKNRISHRAKAFEKIKKHLFMYM
jgi:XTP/dITP diphosphohydrolase